MSRLLIAFLLLLQVFCAIGAAGQNLDVPPAPTSWVTDRAQVLSPQTRATLERRLESYAREKGPQIIVWIDASTGSMPIETFAVQAFERWKVGRAGLDDGAALFVFMEDRKVRIEIGYGLEGTVTDLAASRMIRDVIAPRLAAGDPDGAITGGIEALIRAIEGEAATQDTGSPGSEGALETEELGPVEIAIGVILAIAFVILMFTHPRLALFLLYVVMSGGRGGGGGGGMGGGGFRGGGGRSGGGGATGGW